MSEQRRSFSSPDPFAGGTKRVPSSNRKKVLKGLLIFLGAVTLVSAIALGTGFWHRRLYLVEAFQNHYETNKLDQEVGKVCDFGRMEEIARLSCGIETESEAFLSDPENAKGFPKPYEQIAPTLERNKEKIDRLIDKVIYILTVYRHDHAR